ncbi:Trehalose-6-P synthase/phosphatase complex synthase subunit [Perkinsus olseni]|uniref:Trehalose-6-P synthase/phosphatase complex synthase subunit n=1 Tax=Perkinsus olseni TaxID=32597 RepID=A0A7J6SWL2_PEROL|nr:Trehalose-6-P synthase/phosphatase complex synthase subunit [Perkinsus olseni]
MLAPIVALLFSTVEGLRSIQDCSYGTTYCRQMYDNYKDPSDTAGAEPLEAKGTYCKPWQFVGNELGSVCYGLAWTNDLDSTICYHSGSSQNCDGLPVSCSCTEPTTTTTTSTSTAPPSTTTEPLT